MGKPKETIYYDVSTRKFNRGRILSQGVTPQEDKLIRNLVGELGRVFSNDQLIEAVDLTSPDSLANRVLGIRMQISSLDVKGTDYIQNGVVGVFRPKKGYVAYQIEIPEVKIPEIDLPDMNLSNQEWAILDAINRLGLQAQPEQIVLDVWGEAGFNYARHISKYVHDINVEMQQQGIRMKIEKTGRKGHYRIVSG